MLDTTPAFAAANAALARTPVYQASFARDYYKLAVMADAPSGYWRFGELTGTSAGDSSGNGLTGTYHGLPRLNQRGALARNDRAVSLDGATQYVTVSDNALLDVNPDTFTLEIWVRPTSLAASQVIFDKGANGYELSLTASTGLIVLSQDAVAQIAISTAGVPIGAWSHVAVTKAGSSVHIYLNGVDVTGTITNQTVAATASGVFIGTRHDFVSFFGGLIDEAAVYPAALSATRVSIHNKIGRLNTKFSTAQTCDYLSEVLDDSPVGFWRSSEAVASPAITTAADSSGNGLAGTYNGAPTLGAVGPLSGSSQTAVTLNGSTQSATVLDNPLLDFGTGAFSLETWVKTTVAGTIPISKGTAGSSSAAGYELIFQSTFIEFAVSGGTVPTSTQITGATAAHLNGLWHHYVCTRDASGNMAIYMDGVVQATGTGAWNVSSASPLAIGARSNASAFVSGSMAQTAIYSTALSAARVAAHYHAAKLGLYRSDVSALMQLPTSTETQVNPDQGTASIGSVSFVLEDAGGAVTSLISGGIGNDQVAFTMGFASIQAEEYAPFSTGIVSAFPLTSDLTGYEITIQDPQVLSNLTIFNTASSMLTQALTSGATSSMTVADASGYQAAGYVKIDGEYIQYGSISNNGVSIQEQPWASIVYGNGLFVAVGTSGGTGIVATSVNGKSWVEGTAPSNVLALNAVTFGGGMFVACGTATGSGLSYIMTSPDGLNWTTRTNAPTVATRKLTSVTWSPSLSLFAICAAQTGFQAVWTSADLGVTWVAQATPNTASTQITWSPSLGLFSTVFMTSPDGINWTDRSTLAKLSAVAWSPTLGMYAAVGNGFYTSTDGLTWTPVRITGTLAQSWQAVTWSPFLGMFIVIGLGATSYRSTDGVNWTPQTLSMGGLAWNALASSGSAVVAVGSDGSGTIYCIRTTDGFTWVSIASLPTAAQWSGVVWSPGLSLFATVSTDSQIATSPDGVTWTLRTGGAGANYNAITWSPSLGLFLAVGPSSNVLTSTNGTTWTLNFVITANTWTSVMWSAALSLFVAVSLDGTDRVAYSSTGTTSWTNASTATFNGQWQGVAYSPALGQFVAVGAAQGSTTTITARPMTSSNGTTWASVQAAESNSWNALIWGPAPNSVFLAISSLTSAINSPDNGMISADGITWSVISGAFASSVQWTSIVWDATLGQFVAVASSGSVQIMTSPDGHTWTSGTIGTNAWQAITTNGSTLVAVANSGTAGSGFATYNTSLVAGSNWIPAIGRLLTLARAQFGSVAAAHSVGAQVAEILVITGHPMDIYQSILVNTDKTGCGIPISLVDTVRIAAAKVAIGTTYSMRFVISGPVNAKTFIQSQLFLPTACYPIVTGGGKYSVIHYTTPVTSIAVINHDNILESSSGAPALTWDPNFVTLINSVTFNFDYSASASNAYASTKTFTDPASIARYGVVQLIINSQGLMSSIPGTLGLLAVIGAQILARYSNGGAPLINVDAFLYTALLEAGDIVGVTSALIPNRVAFQRGVTGLLCEVIARTPKFDSGTTSFQLLQTSA